MKEKEKYFKSYFKLKKICSKFILDTSNIDASVIDIIFFIISEKSSLYSVKKKKILN